MKAKRRKGPWKPIVCTPTPCKTYTYSYIPDWVGKRDAGEGGEMLSNIKAKKMGEVRNMLSNIERPIINGAINYALL